MFLDSSKEGNQQPHLEEKARTAVAELAQKRSGPFWACCVLILLHFAVCLKNKECWIRVPYGKRSFILLGFLLCAYFTAFCCLFEK